MRRLFRLPAETKGPQDDEGLLRGLNDNSMHRGLVAVEKKTARATQAQLFQFLS